VRPKTGLGVSKKYKLFPLPEIKARPTLINAGLFNLQIPSLGVLSVSEIKLQYVKDFLYMKFMM
jgi:hypothetical protein